MIHIKTEAEIAKMRAAGLVVSAALEAVRAAIAPGVTTADLDAIAERVIRDAGATSNFKGYRGGAGGQVPYPGSICASINDEVVHGIPDAAMCCATATSSRSTAARSSTAGTATPRSPLASARSIRPIQTMLDVCEESMWRGIAAGVAGGRLGDIGHAVESYVRSQGSYGIVEEYGGHGIGTAMHQEPHVPNHGRRGRGLTLQPGLTLAVEPMIMMGKRHLVTLDDDWTVVTVDGSWAAHFEHTFAVTRMARRCSLRPIWESRGWPRSAQLSGCIGAVAVRTVVERGPKDKRSVAFSIDWPGWSRGAKSAELALETLESYRARYRPVARLAKMAREFDAAGPLKDRRGTRSEPVRPTSGASPSRRA